MRLSQHPQREKVLVILDGNRWIRAAIEADDKEGWVEIPDLDLMSPAIPEPNEKLDLENLETEGEKLITKTLKGKVTFIIPEKIKKE